MPTKIIREPLHVDALAILLKGRKMPITVSWTQGASQSAAQNRLQHKWYSEIAAQLGDVTHEEVRAQCKMQVGIPILTRDSEGFKEKFSIITSGMEYGRALEVIEALQIPVTSLMTTPQMNEYLNAVQRKYTAQGVRLTDPEALKYQEEFGEIA